MIDRAYSSCRCAELLARVEALSARLDALTSTPPPFTAMLTLSSGAVVDRLRGTVSRGDAVVRITPACWRLLDRLADHGRQSVTALAIWYYTVGEAGPYETHGIQVVAHRLRKHLAEVGARDDLLTTSAGYMLEVAS